MEYDLVQADTAFELVCRINRLLDKGWKLHGNTFVLHYPTSSHPATFWQALVKSGEVVR